MYNQQQQNSSSSSSEHHHMNSKGGPPPPIISPRISFSNDFADSSHPHSHAHSHQMRSSYRNAPVSSDFEFSTSNYSMMSADELFYNGRLLPLKEGCSSSSGKTTTLRDELMQSEEDDNDNGVGGFSLRPPKNPTRWKGFLGLRKSHIGSKKAEKVVAERNVEKRNNNACNHDDDDVQSGKNSSQDFVD